jgi:hypothetical protein
MPGSLTTPGRTGARAGAPVRLAFRHGYGVGARDCYPFAAQWLACAIPCRRFAAGLATGDARLGADVGRYSFTVSDSHRRLLAGLPAHNPSISPDSGKEIEIFWKEKESLCVCASGGDLAGPGIASQNYPFRARKNICLASGLIGDFR